MSENVTNTNQAENKGDVAAPSSSHGSAFFEEVTARSRGDIVLSIVRPATTEEIKEARRLHEHGECPHNIVVDKKGWMYDYRVCVTCGKGMGAI